MTDDKVGQIKCPKSSLEAGESMTCKSEGVAEKGQYKNEGRVRAQTNDGTEVGDKDDSHYLGVEAGKATYPNRKIDQR